MRTTWLGFGLVALIPAAMAGGSDDAEGEGTRAGSRSAVGARSDALFEAYAAEVRAYREAGRRDGTDATPPPAPPDGPAYAGRFLAIAREAGDDDPAAAEALTRALGVDFGGPRWKEAIGRIAERHVESPGIGPALRLMAMDTTPPEVEPILRAAMARNPHAEVRAQAALALSTHLRRLAVEAENLTRHPDRFERAARAFGRASTERMRDRDPDALRRESEALLERVVADHADIRGPAGEPGPAEQAAAELFAIRELVAGKPAPEIEGVDADGVPMRLSDHRGKVVALVWWATWCAPCMAMVPRERQLVRRLEGRPFVLLGVNGDEDAARLRRQVEDRQIPWRSWFDGGPDGPISTRWNVRTWPTVFILDREGVIRFKGHRDQDGWEAAIEALLAPPHEPGPGR